MTTVFSACYSDGSRFVSLYFEDRSKATNLARKMSKEYNNTAFVSRCTGNWIGEHFSENTVTTVAVYTKGKKD